MLIKTQNRGWKVHLCVFSENPREGQRERDENIKSANLWEVRLQVTFSPFSPYFLVFPVSQQSFKIITLFRGEKSVSVSKNSLLGQRRKLGLHFLTMVDMCCRSVVSLLPGDETLEEALCLPSLSSLLPQRLSPLTPSSLLPDAIHAPCRPPCSSSAPHDGSFSFSVLVVTPSRY